MNDYLKIIKVLYYITQYAQKRPSTQKLANIAGINTYNFEQKFINWVGITPKSYLECLNPKNKKMILQESRNIMAITNETAPPIKRSSYKFCIKLVTANPTEIKNGGEALDISYDFGPTPFGECLLAKASKGICHLAFIDQNERKATFNRLKELWPMARFLPQKKEIHQLINKIFNPLWRDKNLTFNLYTPSTYLQARVWSALISIPEGHTISYSELAKSVQRSQASRAIGNILSKNQIAYLIPCHRVIRSSGIIGNYRWGSQRKKSLLTFERARNLPK